MRLAWYGTGSHGVRSIPKSGDQRQYAEEVIRKYQADDADQSFRGNGKLTSEQEEIRQLKAQIKQLKLEREILKEATVFFAKETK